MQSLQNEIRDFVARAPKPFEFTGFRMLSFERVRNVWLEEISAGNIDQRINRRSGLIKERPFYAQCRIAKSIRRNHRNRLRHIGLSICY